MNRVHPPSISVYITYITADSRGYIIPRYTAESVSRTLAFYGIDVWTFKGDTQRVAIC